LQGDALKLGTNADDENFRKQISDKMQKTSGIMKKLQLDLAEFKTMNLPYEKEVIKSHFLKFLQKQRN
jgi:hypothetical protein